MSEENLGDQGFSFNDKRRIDPETGAPRESAPTDESTSADSPAAEQAPEAAEQAPEDVEQVAADASAAADDTQPGDETSDLGVEIPDDASELTDPPAQAGTDGNVDVAAEALADLKRLNAEYASYRMRSQRERDVAKAEGMTSVVNALIPVLDEVRLARENGDVTGPFETHTKKLLESLTKLGIEQYGEVGEPFDPAIHEALMQQPSDDVEADTVFLVMQPGYKIGDRVLRAARVGVHVPN